MTNPGQSRHLNSHFRRGSGKQAHSEQNRQVPTETTLRDEPTRLPWTSFRPERADFFFLVRSCSPRMALRGERVGARRSGGISLRCSL